MGRKALLFDINKFIHKKTTEEILKYHITHKIVKKLEKARRKRVLSKRRNKKCSRHIARAANTVKKKTSHEIKIFNEKKMYLTSFHVLLRDGECL